MWVFAVGMTGLQAFLTSLSMSSRVHDVMSADRCGTVANGVALLIQLSELPYWRPVVSRAFDAGLGTLLKTSLLGHSGSPSGPGATHRSGPSSPTGTVAPGSGRVDWRSEEGTRGVASALAALYTYVLGCGYAFSCHGARWGGRCMGIVAPL